MRAVLDGHPSLEVVPIESHFFQFAGWPILYPYKKQKATAFDLERFRTRALESIREYNTSDGFTSDVNLKSRFDERVFVQALPTRGHEIDESLLLAYFNAIKLSLGLSPLDCGKIVVEKSIENAELAWAIRAMFPESKFIHVIRDPYSNFVSIRKFKTLNNIYPSLPEIIGCLDLNYHFLELNAAILKDYLVLRYEDLLFSRDKTLSQISSFLGIDFLETLKRPTVLSQPWGGNSGKGLNLTSIDTSPAFHWKQEIRPIEVYYVNRFFSHIIRKFDYESLPATGSLLSRNEGEEIKTYIRNRIYKIFTNETR